MSPGDPTQLNLFDPPPPPDQDIYSRWFAFHLANPHAYRILRELALEARRVEGREQFGIGALNEVARWYKRYSTEGEPYKMPDNFRSMYARMLMEQEPLLAGFFREHRLRTATWPTDPASVRARTASVV